MNVWCLHVALLIEFQVIRSLCVPCVYLNRETPVCRNNFNNNMFFVSCFDDA